MQKVVAVVREEEDMKALCPAFEESDYATAVKVCRDIGRISTSAIQRHLRVGYVKACLIVEAMGERGIAEQVDPDGVWMFTNTPPRPATQGKEE